jgi:hypothetical protein
LAALNALASVHADVGNLDWVRRVVSLPGMASAAPGFDRLALVHGTPDRPPVEPNRGGLPSGGRPLGATHVR